MKTAADIKLRMHDYYIANKHRWDKYRKPPQTPEEKLAVKIQKTQWKEAHPEKVIWSGAKYRAAKAGLEFNLEMSDIVIPEFCPYLGIRLTCKKGDRRCDSLMSLDRIDPKKGYIKGNVEVISYKANRMKNNANRDELIIFSKNVIKKYEGTLP